MKSSEDLRQPQNIIAKNKQGTSSDYINVLIYPLPIRIFHFTLIPSLSLAIISGLLISFTYPLLPMRTIRLVHVSAGR